MDSYTYVLSPTHHHNVIQQLNCQRTAEQKHLCDLHLKIGSHRLYAHRGVMAACSKYFQALFSGSFHKPVGDYETEVDLTSCSFDPQYVETVITTVYMGSVVLSLDNIAGVTEIACYLMLDDLRNICQTFLEEHVCLQTCQSFYCLAFHFDLVRLLRMCQSLFCSRFHDFFIFQDEMLSISCECLRHLFQDFDVIVYTKTAHLVKFFLRWVMASSDCSDLRRERIAASKSVLDDCAMNCVLPKDKRQLQSLIDHYFCLDDAAFVNEIPEVTGHDDDPEFLKLPENMHFAHQVQKYAIVEYGRVKGERGVREHSARDSDSTESRGQFVADVDPSACGISSTGLGDHTGVHREQIVSVDRSQCDTREVVVGFVPLALCVQHYMATEITPGRLKFCPFSFAVVAFSRSQRKWVWLGEATFPVRFDEKDIWKVSCLSTSAYFLSLLRHMVWKLNLRTMKFDKINCNSLFESLTAGVNVQSLTPFSANSNLYVLASDKLPVSDASDAVLTHQRYYRLEHDEHNQVVWTPVVQVEYEHRAMPLSVMNVYDDRVYVAKLTQIANANSSMRYIQQVNVFDTISGTVDKLEAVAFVTAPVSIFVNRSAIYIIDGNSCVLSLPKDTEREHLPPDGARDRVCWVSQGVIHPSYVAAT